MAQANLEQEVTSIEMERIDLGWLTELNKAGARARLIPFRTSEAGRSRSASGLKCDLSRGSVYQKFLLLFLDTHV